MSQFLQNKKGLVQKVFDKVYDKYDLMNDFMSFGIHRLWKKDLIMMMSPSVNKKLIDVACGTGDIGKLFLDSVKYKGKVFNIDPNKKMIKEGEKKFKYLKNISWKLGSAEKLDFKNNYFDYYTISFGLRNTKNINHSIKEAYRVLKPDGIILTLVPDWEANYKTYFDDFTHRTPFTRVALKDAYKMYGFQEVSVFKFRQLPIVWKYPIINYFCAFISPLIPVRTQQKFLRWSRELLLIGYGIKPKEQHGS